MRWFLAFLSILAFLGGCGHIAGTQTVFHQVLAYIAFLASAVLLSGAAICDQLVTAFRWQQKRDELLVAQALREPPAAPHESGE